MKSFRSRYTYDKDKPLREPYHQQNKVYNAYFKGFDTLENKSVLISEYSTPNFAQIQAIAKRISIIKEIKHKNLVEIYEIVVLAQQCTMMLVLEWCEGGSILDYIEKEGEGKQKQKNMFVDYRVGIKIISEIMDGVLAIHSRDIIHRSINLQNIEISSEGIAKLSIKCLIFKSYYLSPEQKKNTHKSKQNDIFSLGVSLYRLIYGGSPFKSQSLQLYFESVKQGPKFSSKSKMFLPIEVPQSVKQLISIMLNLEPTIRSQCFNKIKQFNHLKNNSLSYNKEISKVVLSNQYIQILKNKDLSEETVITVLNIHEKIINKIILFKSDANTLNNYFEDVSRPYVSAQNKQFVNIRQQRKLDKYLMLLLDYDNQGSLKEYYEIRNQKLQSEKITLILESINNSLKKLGTPYFYLSNQSIKIHKGDALLTIPPFPTKQFNSSLRDKKRQIDFISPQVREGKINKYGNSDSWSVGVLQYWMMFNIMPSYDNFSQLFIPDREKCSSKDITQLLSLIEKNPAKRKNQLKPHQIIFIQSDNDDDVNFAQNLKNNKNQKISISPKNSPRKQSEEDKRKSPRSPRMKDNRESKRSNFSIGDESILMVNFNEKNQISSLQKTPRRDQENLIFNEDKNSKQRNSTSMKNQRNQNGLKNQRNQSALRKPPLPNKQNISIKIGERIYRMFSFLDKLEKSWTKPLRVLLKCAIGLLLFIFLFYFPFLQITGRLIVERSTYQPLTVSIRTFQTDTIASVNYTLVTKTRTYTTSIFTNSTVINLRDNQQCALNNYGGSSNIVSILNSKGFGAYLVFGILLAILNLFFICLTLSKIDFPKAFSLCVFEQNSLSPLLNFLIVQLALSSLTSCIYLIYGSLFHLTTTPCFHKPLLPSLQYLLKSWYSSFFLRFVWVYLGLIIAYGVIIYILLTAGKPKHKIFYIVIILLYFIGVGGRGMGGFVSQSTSSIFGVFGELLCLINGIIFFFIDFVFAICLQKTQEQVKLNKDSVSPNNNNNTQVFFFEDALKISDE